MANNTLKRKWEFWGMSLMTALTLYWVILSLSFISRTFPAAATDPKYLFAVEAVITAVLGSFNAAFVSPSTTGMVNTSKKVESTYATRSSGIISVPFLTNLLLLSLLVNIRVNASTCG